MSRVLKIPIRLTRHASITIHLFKKVIVPAPFWVSYTEMVTMANATPVVVDTTPEEGFIMSAAKLKAALTPKSRLLILCTPSNPTGAVYSKWGM